MSTFRNIFAAVVMALFLFVGLAVVPSAAMAEDYDIGIDDLPYDTIIHMRY